MIKFAQNFLKFNFCNRDENSHLSSIIIITIIIEDDKLKWALYFHIA